MSSFPCHRANLAGCREEVRGCLVLSDWNLYCQTVWRVDTHQDICGTADAVTHSTLRGRHRVDAGEQVQPLWEREEGVEERVEKEREDINREREGGSG